MVFRISHVVKFQKDFLQTLDVLTNRNIPTPKKERAGNKKNTKKNQKNISTTHTHTHTKSKKSEKNKNI